MTTHNLMPIGSSWGQGSKPVPTLSDHIKRALGVKLAARMNDARAQHDRLLDLSSIAVQFIPAYDSGERITVSFRDANGREYERKRGTVSLTTGWRPCFILMLRRNSRGSSYRLSDRDVIVPEVWWNGRRIRVTKV